MSESAAEKGAKAKAAAAEKKAKAAAGASKPRAPKPAGFDGPWIEAPSDPDGYARELYANLRALDAAGADAILIETPPDDPAWLAVSDRLARATHRG